MATTYSWPPSLPQYPEKGFSESGGVQILRTPMDQGPAKQRRVGKAPSTLNTTFFMTTAQVATLEDFVENTIKGVARFLIPHPRKLGTDAEVRIVPQGSTSFYTIQYNAPGYWNVQINLEILP